MTEPEPLFPTFEDHTVHAAHLKLSIPASVELPDVVVHVDDTVYVLVEAKVTGVNHSVHAPTGHLVRVQTAKAVDCQVVARKLVIG